MYQAYYLDLLDVIYNKIRFTESENTSVIESFKKQDLLTIACHLGNKDCVTKSCTFFAQWQSDKNKNP